MTQNNQDATIYPFKTVNHVCGFIRSYSPAGKIRSLDYNPERTSTPQAYGTLYFYNPFSGAVEIQNVKARDALYVSVTRALKAILSDCHFTDDEKKAFKWACIGQQVESDTGDYLTLTYEELAKVMHRNKETIGRWVRKVKDSFEVECARRQLISPIEL